MGSKTGSLLLRFFLYIEKPVFAFLIAFVAYFLLSRLGGSPFRVTRTAYFNYLADAFLHGQLYLRLLPITQYDLSHFNGHYYLYWPPMPAILLMPFVQIFGVGFSDVFFNTVLASLNVAVVAALLRAADRAGLIRIPAAYRALLVCFFAFGTSHLILALFGRVWFTAQLLGILLVGLAYLAAIKLEGALAFLVTGTLMGCAMLTRNHLIFTGIWPAYYLLMKNWTNQPKVYLYALMGAMPVFVMALLFLGYNYARFNNPLEVGIRYHNMAVEFVSDYKKYGAFNLHYLPSNFYYQYIYYPLPPKEESYMGGSLFLLSPVFFYSFRTVMRQYRNPNIWLWLVSILATSIPILLLMGTGWIQYGPRYTLDFIIPLLLLTASGIQGTSANLLAAITILSVMQYIPGIPLFVKLHL
jgi:hypothetical protein